MEIDRKCPVSNLNLIDFCKICQLKLPNNVTMNEHIFAQAHNNLYKQKMNRNKRCGLHIRGYGPNEKKNLLQHFSKFGTIIWAHFGCDFLLLDYSDEVSVKAALDYQGHRVNNKRLYVNRRRVKQNNPHNVNQDKLDGGQEADDLFEYLLGKLRGSLTLYQQFQTLFNIIQADVSVQLNKCDWICYDLQNVLASGFSWCHVHPFGSTITGLNFQNSDLDVFISGMRKDNEVRDLYKARQILLVSQRFRNAIVIAHAKIPILKCIHVKTNISCDINMKNMLGVCNTQLIKYYLAIDSKIKMLLFTLKYWAMVHKITGQNHLFTNYSLSLMVIFFLQQEPFKLPSVSFLQSNPRFHNMQDGWNGGFQTLHVRVSEMRKTSDLDLFVKFFDFYANFEYGTYLICPFMGCLITKNSFKTPDTLPASFNLYKNYIKAEGAQPLKVDATICIQDPFEHSRNSTPIVSESTLMAFVSFCRQGKKICLEGEKNFLYKLFTQQPPDFKPELLSGAQSRQFVILMGASLAYLTGIKTSDGEERKNALYNAWFKNVDKFLVIVLRDFLKFTVVEIGTQTHIKNKKIEGQSDIHDNREKVGYRCSAKINFWAGRKAAKNVSEKAGLIERESAIANHLSDLYKDIKPVDNIIEMTIHLRRKLDPPGVIVDIIKVQCYKKTFKSFASYFVTNFMSWFQNYEKELNQAGESNDADK